MTTGVEQGDVSRGLRDASGEGQGDPLACHWQHHLHMLMQQPTEGKLNELTAAPIFTAPVAKYARNLSMRAGTPGFTQYGLIGGDSHLLANKPSLEADPRLFFNVSAPSSVFICGSQGSGKSHTLSCLIENCLLQSEVGELPHPLTGVIFHYDTFSSDAGGSPCEAAYLSSHKGMSVRVLCPPTNVTTIKVSSFPLIAS
jgi:hypothetical protein